jgi:gliding motility-associated protein GldE
VEPPSIEPLSGLLISVNSISISLIIALLVIIVLLISSALVSGSEVAFFSLSPNDKEELEKSKTKSAERVLKMLNKPKRLLANILVANNFINIAIVMISTYIVGNLFAFQEGEELTEVLITVIGVTFLILLMGEVIPKVYAANNSLFLSKLMSSPLIFTGKLVYPLSSFLIKSTSFIDKKIKKKGNQISIYDLENALEITDIEGATEDDKKILEGIVKFGNTDVKQIMKSRMDVVTFSCEETYPDLLAKIIESRYSRIPIYKESFDNILGVLYVKDLLPHLNKQNINWIKLLREPFIVPENKKIDDLLKQFQDSKVHIAIVVDEYGGTSGIVTLEDIIEEIIGDITDEFDEDDVVYTKIDKNNYVFEGKVSLVDMYKVLDIEGDDFEENKGESDTLAGFLIEQSGKILKKNERLKFGNYTFVVEAADKRRIKQIKLTIDELIED